MGKLVDSFLISNVLCALRSALRGTGYLTAFSCDFVVQDALVLAPDAWVLERRKYELLLRPDDYLGGVPDLAILRHTPQERREVTRHKITTYLRHGTRQVWLTSAESNTLYVFDRDPAAPKPYSISQSISLPAPMPPVAIPLQEIFDLEWIRSIASR